MSISSARILAFCLVLPTGAALGGCGSSDREQRLQEELNRVRQEAYANAEALKAARAREGGAASGNSSDLDAFYAGANGQQADRAAPDQAPEPEAGEPAAAEQAEPAAGVPLSMAPSAQPPALA